LTIKRVLDSFSSPLPLLLGYLLPNVSLDIWAISRKFEKNWFRNNLVIKITRRNSGPGFIGREGGWRCG